MRNSPDLWRDQLPQLSCEGHKYDRGHALIIGGYPMTGAARLAARAAARIGAGVATVAVPAIAFSIYATALTSIMVHALENESDLVALLTARSFSGILTGPGSGISARTRNDVLAVLAMGLPTVLDADALSSFSDDPSALFSATHVKTVLTPHEGEFARLFNLQSTKADRALRAAAQSNAIIVLKGGETVIAAPDGRVITNGNAPPTLATAGSGDVLSGIILGLLTQGMEPFLAAAAGVWMHGAAATAFGPGLIAEDLPDLLPTVLRQYNT